MQTFYNVFLLNNKLLTNKVAIITLLIFLLIATYTDIKKLKIYNKFNLTFLITRFILILVPVCKLTLGVNDLLGGILGFLFLLIPATILMHPMGGDIKFIGIIGLYLGIKLLLPFLLIACMYNLIYILILFKSKKNLDKKSTKTPFAPFFLLSFLTLLMISLVF